MYFGFFLHSPVNAQSLQRLFSSSQADGKKSKAIYMLVHRLILSDFINISVWITFPWIRISSCLVTRAAGPFLCSQFRLSTGSLWIYSHVSHYMDLLLQKFETLWGIFLTSWALCIPGQIVQLLGQLITMYFGFFLHSPLNAQDLQRLFLSLQADGKKVGNENMNSMLRVRVL